MGINTNIIDTIAINAIRGFLWNAFNDLKNWTKCTNF